MRTHPTNTYDDTWLIVPLYNEATVVQEVVREARRTFPHIVCIDDGSSDGSAEQALAGGAVFHRQAVHHLFE